MRSIGSLPLSAGMLLVLAGTGCDTDSIVVPAGQNQAPEVVMLADLDCVPADRDVLFDLSQTVDDHTDAGDLEFRMDWESDGTFDTPWVREPAFSHRYPQGSHDATVTVRDGEFQAASATCRVLVVQEDMPIAVTFRWYTLDSFQDFSNPTRDTVNLYAMLELGNESGLWFTDLTLDMRAYLHDTNELLAVIPITLTCAEIPWDNRVPANSSLVVVAQRIDYDSFLFEPPCGQAVYLELCLSTPACWEPRRIRTNPFVFHCMGG